MCPAIAISANGDPARFARFGLPVLPDGAFKDHGPLAGVLAGMRWAEDLGASTLLTVPGDTPVPAARPGVRPVPGACLRGQWRAAAPSCGVWRTRDRNLLQTFLQTPGKWKVSRFAEEIGMRYVDFPRADARWFVNVNTPDDLVRLET